MLFAMIHTELVDLMARYQILGTRQACRCEAAAANGACSATVALVRRKKVFKTFSLKRASSHAGNELEPF